MTVPRSYLVRIYRQGFDLLGGTLQDLSTTGSRSFASLSELGDLLRAPIDPSADPHGVAPTDRTPDPGE